ncbi:MAG: leucine-rich repeat domain-containing protein, partial [Clostridia bacterium]|nr:leucine-rich repeat domain-containing protein [Clostridia bacterium]
MKKKHSFLLCCLALASIATAFSACAGSSDRSSSSRSSSSYSRSSSSTSSSSSSSSSSVLPPEPECTHEWSEWEVLSEPTCSVQGMRTHYCLECEETESEKLLLLPHTLSEDFTRCEVCGITHTGYYLNYKMNGDAKSAAITGVTNGYGLTLFIPAEDTVQIVAGKPAAKTVPITSIDSNMSFVEVNTLILGQNIKSIGEYAFSNSRSLASVYIPAAFANLPDAALSGCRNLREFIVEEDNPNFKAIDGNLYTKDGETLLRYASGNERKTFTVPDGVKKIAPYAFRNARYLQSLVLPEGLTTIGTYAFENAKELTQIEFPSTIRVIDENAFRESGIDVQENYEDGVLYHSNVLVKAQDAPHTYRVKDGTVCIAAGAFSWGNSNLMDVTLPASVKGINTYSFGLSQTGATIRFEGNVEEVAERAFFHSSGVEEIHFSENVTEWNTGIMNGFLNLKTIYFDGTMSDYCKMEMPILPTDCVENVCVNGVALAEMEEVMLDDTATVINAHSFVGTPLRKLTISGSVQTIDTRALENLESLEQIVYAGAIDKWLAIESDYAAIYAAAPVSFSAAQGNELRIPDGVEEIKSWAFKDQPYQSLVLPQSLLTVEENAFAGCENLASVNYLDGVEGWCTVDTDYAFLAKAALLFNGTQVAGTLEIPGSLETIKSGTFRNQASITELQFGETLTKIEAGAFADCLGIEKVCYAGSVEGWCEIDTDYAFLERAELYFGAEKLQGKLTIPQTITRVRDNTFQNQTSLTEIVLPEELETLGEEAFKGCSNVETATTPVRFAQTIVSLPVRALTLLGAGETEVEDSAFLEQTLLETVTLQGNFKSVGASAFEGCSSLQTLTLSGTIESVGEKAF